MATKTKNDEFHRANEFGLADELASWTKCVSSATRKDIEDAVRQKMDKKLIPDEATGRILEAFVRMLVRTLDPHSATKDEYTKAYIKARRKFKAMPRKPQLLHVYRQLYARGEIERHPALEGFVVHMKMRSLSGVLVVTLFTSAYPETSKGVQPFSCKHNCYYCPNEPGLPRSYLSEEPGVARGKRHKWNPVDQFNARVWTYVVQGHPIDKIELLVLGGTWSEYPREYQESFVTDIYWAANTFFDPIPKRPRRSLEEEQRLNTTGRVRIIGLTLETRPDAIDLPEIRRMRDFGCTRVQLGIQHTDDAILKKVNRGCTTADALRATKLIKDAGLKLDYHLMPDLPGSTPENDMEMFDRVLSDPGLQADQWKIYPHAVVPWTVTKKWLDEGTFVPFSDEDLMELLLAVKVKVHPWIRLNRVIRDIPETYITGGNKITNLRQLLHVELKKRGQRCRCIRCREVRDLNPKKMPRAVLKRREYDSSGGREIFLSYETEDEHTIFGFVRLRLPPRNPKMWTAFPELKDCALVRELHVYGQMRPVDEDGRVTNATKTKRSGRRGRRGKSPSRAARKDTQHVGFGRRLMGAAERIATSNGFQRIAVIAGIGTREYYRKKLGYELDGTYMVKEIGLLSRFGGAKLLVALAIAVAAIAVAVHAFGVEWMGLNV